MKRIYLNLKRFDVPAALGGVNRLAPAADWGRAVAAAIAPGLGKLAGQAEFAAFLPEAQLPGALAAAQAAGGALRIGCQGVAWRDVAPGGNFGALTGQRPAAAMAALGVTDALIGHCEERTALGDVLASGGAAGPAAARAVNGLLNRSVRAALARGMRVLYCIGETEDEQPAWQQVLAAQLDEGLAGLSQEEKARVAVAYEPVWSIGPGRTPADGAYIQKVARFIKEEAGLPVVYGGGLKAANAAELAALPEVDGGLIALTRFAGDIGFYPDEYFQIIRLYLGA